MNFSCFHPDEFDKSRNGEKCDYPMNEEILDTGWLLLTCSKCGHQIFVKPEAKQ